jgi:hypothetical protein
VIKFRLRKKGTVELVVRNASCSVVGSKRVHGRRGLNHVRFAGRLHGRPLAPGTYSIVLVVIRGSSRSEFGAITVQVVPPGRHLTKAQRSAPLADPCYVAAAAAQALPVAVVSTAGPARARAVAAEPTAEQTKRPKAGVLGVSLKPPHLPLSIVHGAPTWLGVLLFGVFGIAVAALIVYVTRFLRGSWNP